MLNNFSVQFEKTDNFETDYLKILYYDLSKDYIGDYIYSHTMTIKEIAYSLNLSPASLIQHFKNATGMTPKEYQNLLKINQSKEDLLLKNVSEVAYDLGFESISYFIKLFKHHLGITPKQYTMLHKKRADSHSVKMHQALVNPSKIS